MNLLNKSNTILFSNKRKLPLIPYIEKRLKDEVIIGFIPGCIICSELNQEFAPIGDEIKTFPCKEDDGFIFEFEGVFDRFPPRIREIKLKQIQNIDELFIESDQENSSTKKIPLARIKKNEDGLFYIENIITEINYLSVETSVKFQNKGEKENISTNISIY